jgi:hypothetical protein
MSIRSWSISEVEHGRNILNSGLQGVRSGQETFLRGEPLGRFLAASSRSAYPAAALGAVVGVLASCSGNARKSLGRSVAFGLLGGAIGFGAAVAWKSRGLTASAARDAVRNIHTVRDERWMKKHFIAYA